MKLFDTPPQVGDRTYTRFKTPLIPYKQSGATSTRVSDYAVGTRVLHSKYGYGQIIEFNNKLGSSNHLIRIKYDNGQTNSYELEILIKAGTISICE